MLGNFRIILNDRLKHVVGDFRIPSGHPDGQQVGIGSVCDTDVLRHAFAAKVIRNDIFQRGTGQNVREYLTELRRGSGIVGAVTGNARHGNGYRGLCRISRIIPGGYPEIVQSAQQQRQNQKDMPDLFDGCPDQMNQFGDIDLLKRFSVFGCTHDFTSEDFSFLSA